MQHLELVETVSGKGRFTAEGYDRPLSYTIKVYRSPTIDQRTGEPGKVKIYEITIPGFSQKDYKSPSGEGTLILEDGRRLDVLITRTGFRAMGELE